MSSPTLPCATVRAPTNIAVIKYWGKRDQKLNLPINSSVSVTLNQEHLCTTTTAVASKDFEADEIYLNGNKEDFEGNTRIQRVVVAMRKMAGDRLNADGSVQVASADWPLYKLRIVSRNNFPTAAGLASSASGYACMVKALAELFNVKETYPGELTAISRQGSGSACRSLYGGFVRWEMGQAVDGKDSIAVQVADEAHWPELEVVICVVSDIKKDTSSTAGMADSVRTSELLAHRATHIVPGRLSNIEAAYKAKDFSTFAEIAMKDSNQFHSTCLDTYPPIFYLNDVSRSIIKTVHALNAEAGEVLFGYTFDAGPNAVLFALKGNLPKLLSHIVSMFPPSVEAAASKAEEVYVQGMSKMTFAEAGAIAQEFKSDAQQPGVLNYLYHTNIGPGASAVEDPSVALVNPVTGDIL